MRRAMRVAIALVLLVAPSVRGTRPPLTFSGPKSQLRLEKNRGWVMHLPFPDPYVDTIGSHVNAMLARGYAADLVSNDLFHGHLLLKPDAGYEYTDVGALLNDAALFLYHTAEFSGRWEREKKRGLPAQMRNPRSIAGFWDGRITPAIALVDPTKSLLQFYESNGTVFDSDIAQSNPGWLEYWQPGAKLIRVGPRAQCRAELQFLLLQDPWGRIVMSDGRRFDVFLRCEPDERELGLGGYDVRPRDFVTKDSGP